MFTCQHLDLNLSQQDLRTFTIGQQITVYGQNDFEPGLCISKDSIHDHEFSFYAILLP